MNNRMGPVSILTVRFARRIINGFMLQGAGSCMQLNPSILRRVGYIGGARGWHQQVRFLLRGGFL
jgi:hypothetical protein